VDFDAIIDTGFTGFLSIPLVEAIRLGLVLHGTTSLTLADGSTSYRLTARAKITIQGEEKIGVAVIEWSSTEVLLGMAFLRQFSKLLYVSQGIVIIEDEPAPVAPTSAASTPTPAP